MGGYSAPAGYIPVNAAPAVNALTKILQNLFRLQDLYATINCQLWTSPKLQSIRQDRKG